MATSVPSWRRLYNRYPAEVISVYEHNLSWFAWVRDEYGAYTARLIHGYCRDAADAWLAARKQFAAGGRR